MGVNHGILHEIRHRWGNATCRSDQSVEAFLRAGVYAATRSTT